MLRLVCTPVPSLRFAPRESPPVVVELRERLRREPERCHWVFPTARLRRAALREWLHERPNRAALLPGLHTLESFVGFALEHCLCQRPAVDGPERLFRMARAWHEASGAPAGPSLLAQLDRFVRDWQSCHLAAKQNSRDLFERFVSIYLRDLDQDQRCDRMSRIVALTAELADAASWPNRVLFPEDTLIVFDGFHRLERVELELIATLGRRCAVLLWLVGTPGQKSGLVLDWMLQVLRELGARPEVIDIDSPLAPLASLGRSLFPVAVAGWHALNTKVKGVADPTASGTPFEDSGRATQQAGLFVLKPRDAATELEAVAARIKADFRAAAATNRPLRLSDVAVIIPGPAYDPLVREVFPRHGLEFNLAGQALGLATARPARLLHAALDLIRGHWRHDLLLDFLRHPLVLRRLDHAQRLDDLIEKRPRGRQRFQFATWSEAWQRHVESQRHRLRRWESGEAPLPEETPLERDEFLAGQRASLDALEKLIASLEDVLQPVAALDRLLSQADSKEPLRKVVEACLALLAAVEIDRWLLPHQQADYSDGPAVPWVEYEKDQQAYSKLLALLEGLGSMPANRLPRRDDGRPDALAALLLALDCESYQIKTEDDAGVQLFELREIRGLRFRHVYVLGLVDGQLPALPEEGVLVSRRRQIEALRIQLEHKEEETQHLFTQVFEAAEEKLVLSQPLMDGDQRTLPSPFLTAVTDRVEVAPLPLPSLVCQLAEAERAIGWRARSGGQPTSPLSPPGGEGSGVRGGDPASLTRVIHDLHAWQQRPGWPEAIRVDVPALLHTLFPDHRPFSTSDLEKYAACPFRYFGSRVLRLSERELDDGRLLYGSLVHRVFQRFYEELRAALNLAADQPLPAVEQAHASRLREIFQQEWQAYEEGYLSPELAPLFAHQRGVLRLFFEVMEQLERTHGNLLNEHVLGDGHGGGIVIGQDAAGRPVAVSGKIDRVDVCRDNPRQAVIADYKTGKPPDRRVLNEKLADGRFLQLPLYAATLEIAHSELQVVGGLYLHLSSKAHKEEPGGKDVLIPVGEVLPGGKPESQPAFDTAAARQKALEFAGLIRQGFFPLSPHTSGAACECTSYCSFRHACRQPDGYETK